MEKIKCFIYKITSPSGRIYIGRTTKLEERIKAYKHLKCKKQPLIYKSLLKYGFDKHQFDIIYENEHTLKEINELEIYFIGIFDSFNGNNENGMNLTLGGDGCFGRKLTDEHKKKIIKANKLRKYKKHSEETKKLISESRKKIGKTEAHQRAIENLKGRKVIKTDEWIKNNAESIKKPILQYDKDLNLIKEWKSATNVEKELGYCRKNIGANLREKTKHAYGFIWKYKKEDN